MNVSILQLATISRYKVRMKVNILHFAMWIQAGFDKRALTAQHCHLIRPDRAIEKKYHIF
jgi:hypothetical protein